MNPVDIAELRRLLAAGTPGRWRHEIDHCSVCVVDSFRIDIAKTWRDANAALIVALVNAAPTILDELEALRARVESAEAKAAGVLAAMVEIAKSRGYSDEAARDFVTKVYGPPPESFVAMYGEHRNASQALSLAGFGGDLVAQVWAALGRNRALKSGLDDLAEHDCTYGDNCPAFGARHGECIGCKARHTLKDACQ